MVLSVLVAIIAAPGLLGTQEAIRQSQAKEKREEHRARRCNLIATCVKSSLRSREINGRPVVLRNGKIYIDTGTSDGTAFGHPYAGYYLPYPDTKYEGLVTTITDEAPIMNWVYVDKETYEVKYGVRANAQPNLTGPFDCTRQDRRLTFDGWEGFCAVEEFPTLWAVYFDMDDDGLRSKLPEGTRVLDIELSRKEKRWKKESDSRQADQTTKREVDAKEDAPYDKPVTTEPQLNPPGAGVEPDAAPPSPFPLPKTIFPEPPPSPVAVRPNTPPPAYTVKSDAVTPSPAAQNKPSPPPNERRTTPKLNRSSGSRTLAQAQMFEAMSQKPSEMPPLRTSKSFTRPHSNSDSASDYSGVGTDIIGAYARPDSSILPPTLEPAAKVSDPAIFGTANGTSPPRNSEPKRSTSRAGAERSTSQPRRKPSVSGAPPSRAPREPLPSIPSSSSNRRPGSPSRAPSRSTPSPAERRTNSVDRTRPLERRPTVSRDPPRSSPRPLRDSSTSKDSPSIVRARERGGSTSSQNTDARPSPRLTRTNTTPLPGKRSMATTMSSGSKTSMSRQMAAPVVPGKDRTNSSLYREIDDILKPSSSRTSSREERNDDRGDERDRPQPLRRTQTSRAPMRRTASGRDKERERDREDRSKGTGEKKPPGVF